MHSHFSVFDWFLVVGFLIFYGWLGLSAKKRAGTLDDFLVMGRKLGPVWGVAACLTTLVGGIYWKRASVTGAYLAFAASAVFPAIGLARPSFSPTLAGLLSFVLAPLGMIVGSLLWPSSGKGLLARDQGAKELANWA
jgi:Na+/proline symporter